MQITKTTNNPLLPRMLWAEGRQAGEVGCMCKGLLDVERSLQSVGSGIESAFVNGECDALMIHLMYHVN